MAFIPSGPGVVVPPLYTDGVPGDVCPSDWDENFDRAQMSTQVLIGRVQPPRIPDLPYTFPGTTPPTSGHITLNAPQSEATVMMLSRTANSGADVTAWLRYLKQDDSIRFAQAGDSGVAIGYRVTGIPTEHPTYFSIPIVWQDGQTPVPSGGALVTLALLGEPPLLFIDAMGKSLYGIETFTRTDLINNSKDLFPELADRILEIRGINSVPRIETVTVDARTGKQFPLQNADMMTRCRPETPTRIRMRLAVDGRPVYDRMCFVNSIRHFISDREWTLRISLDIAEWAGTIGT